MTNRVISPATTAPVSLAEARAVRNLVAYLATSPPSHPQDAVLELGIAAGVEWVESHLELAVGAQIREEVLDAFPDYEIRLPFGPVHSIVSVMYDDENGDEQELTYDKWVLDDVSRPAQLVPASGTAWPATFSSINAVRVRYETGYTCEGDSPDDHPVPSRIKQAVHLFAGHYYENREAVSQGVKLEEIPLGVESILFGLRRPGI